MKFPIATEFSEEEANVGIYIISYMPTDTALREVRMSAMFKQVDWLASVFPYRTKLRYCLQNWNANEALVLWNKLNHFNADYCVVEPKGPSQARNALLKTFYESTDDWGFFFDDDAIFTDHFDGRNFLGSWLKCKEIHCLHPLNPMSMPFNKTVAENKETFDKNWVLNRSVQTKGSSFILKNLKKHHNTEIFFNESIPICEDTDFGYQLVTKGFRVYRLGNVILKELDKGQSTIFTKENRAALTKHHHNLVRTHYGIVAPEGKKGLSGAAVKFFKEQGFMNSGLLIPKDLSAKIPKVTINSVFEEE